MWLNIDHFIIHVWLIIPFISHVIYRMLWSRVCLCLCISPSGHYGEAVGSDERISKALRSEWSEALKGTSSIISFKCSMASIILFVLVNHSLVKGCSSWLFVIRFLWSLGKSLLFARGISPHNMCHLSHFLFFFLCHNFHLFLFFLCHLCYFLFHQYLPWPPMTTYLPMWLLCHCLCLFLCIWILFVIITFSISFSFEFSLPLSPFPLPSLSMKTYFQQNNGRCSSGQKIVHPYVPLCGKEKNRKMLGGQYSFLEYT